MFGRISLAMPAPIVVSKYSVSQPQPLQRAVAEAARRAIDVVADEDVTARRRKREERYRAGHQAGRRQHAVLRFFDFHQRQPEGFVRRRAVTSIGPAAGSEELVGAFDDYGRGALHDRVDAALGELAVPRGVSKPRRKLAFAWSLEEPGFFGPELICFSLSRPGLRSAARPIRTSDAS